MKLFCLITFFAMLTLCKSERKAYQFPYRRERVFDTYTDKGRGLYYDRNRQPGDSVCYPNPCTNGGFCQRDYESYDGYKCICPGGTVGNQCQYHDNPCASSPCRNGGICDPHGAGPYFTCICPYDFVGPRCEFKKDPCYPNPCHGGICNYVYEYQLGYRCTCPPGHTGLSCDLLITAYEPYFEKFIYRN